MPKFFRWFSPAIMPVRSVGWAILLCLLGVGIAFYPTLLSGFSQIQSDPGDTRFNHYLLEHSFQLLVNRHYGGQLWSPTFFYPFPRVLAFAETLWGAAPIYWVFRAFTSPDLAYQLWMIGVSVLNFCTFIVLLERQQVGRELASLGGFLFAFGMPRIAQINHQQLLPQFFTPLALLVLWEFSRQPTRKRLALALLLIYLQVLAGIYLGWFLLLSLLVAIPLLWLLDPEFRSRLGSYGQTYWRSSLAILMGWGLALGVTLAPYLQASKLVGPRLYAEVDQMIPRLESWFLPTSGSLWGGVWSQVDWIRPVFAKLPLPWEHCLFLGFTVLGLLALCLYTGWGLQKIPPQRFLLVKLCLGVSVVLFLLSLRSLNGFSLWQLIYVSVPGATAIRGVTRIWTVLDCYALIAIALGVDTFLKSIKNQRAAWFLLAAICVCSVAEQLTFKLPAYEKSAYLQQETELSQLMQGCDVAYSTVRGDAFIFDQLTAMWAGLQANVPVVNGYSGSAPPHYGSLDQVKDASQVVNWLAQVPEKNRAFQQSQTLCMISRASERSSDSLPTHSEQTTAELKVRRIQLPIAQAFSVKIQSLTNPFPKALLTGTTVQLPVIITNTSNFVWSAWGKHPTFFSYRWLDATGQPILKPEPIRTSLPSDVHPGDSIALNGTIQIPAVPMEYRLVLTMVQENVAWFVDHMPQSVEIPVKVSSTDQL